ncbi:50S ribosomal protein L4 [Candidatus Nomurabacteria bacterium]|nr:50S ribosomal protein L4 [Candidatus Nomurabacteria bacterium]
MEAKIYNQKGKEAGSVKLPKAVFEVSWNADLVHQVVTSMLSDRRKPYAHTKDRAQVSGGGKKPWQQKGTGRARHGSTRSPIWVGGGVAHGPNALKNFARKVNKKMKAKALYTILSRKFNEGEILFVDKLSFSAPKTAEAVSVLKSFAKVKGYEKLSSKKDNLLYIGLSSKNAMTEKSFGNIGNVIVEEWRNINPADILNYKYILIEDPESFAKVMAGKMK